MTEQGKIQVFEIIAGLGVIAYAILKSPFLIYESLKKKEKKVGGINIYRTAKRKTKNKMEH
jgi:hypothetical protein